ncbi:MAG: 30S ribosomal protein S4 [Candidatus Liptonbacteria bacterium]|nr:30S ribosomal protein S4 [Candidatus Liptonbacteria bacterium]
MMGPKEKKERALGEHLHLKARRCLSAKCALVRRPQKPGVHAKSKRRRMLSDFGRQIREKQKFKLIYGIDERSLSRVFNQARQSSGSTVDKLIELVGRRLDNAIFKLGFGGSRSEARQLVVHGHIMVNQRRVRSPGFLVKTNDIVTVRPESKSKTTFRALSESLKNYEPPAWIHLDKEKLEGKILGLPEEERLPVEMNLLVESLNK